MRGLGRRRGGAMHREPAAGGMQALMQALCPPGATQPHSRAGTHRRPSAQRPARPIASTMQCSVISSEGSPSSSCACLQQRWAVGWLASWAANQPIRRSGSWHTCGIHRCRLRMSGNRQAAHPPPTGRLAARRRHPLLRSTRSAARWSPLQRRDGEGGNGARRHQRQRARSGEQGPPHHCATTGGRHQATHRCWG